MSKNNNLHKAKRDKNDEFFTQMSDIEKELLHYTDHFRDKVVYCNCDSPDSNFVKYFKDNYDTLGLKGFYHTWYDSSNGDFRSPESIEILKEADIVVTNPPFSLFREFIAQLIEYDKKFLVVGTLNMIGYKENFAHILNNKLWLGTTTPKQFTQPDGTIKKFGNIVWFTNLEHKKRNEEIILYKEYNGVDFPKYDNFDGINVNKVNNIPINYKDIVGVPLTFMNNFNPNQFEIVGFRKGDDGKDLRVNGEDMFSRILIKNKQL